MTTTTGGLTFDLTFDLTFSASSGGDTVTVTNDGNVPTPAVFTIDGPVSNPTIENTTLGKELSFDIVLGASDQLVVDTAARTVVLNGTASRYNTLTPDSEWFEPLLTGGG